MLDDLEVRWQLAGSHHAQGHSTGGQLERAKVVTLGLNGCHCRQGSANEKRQSTVKLNFPFQHSARFRGVAPMPLIHLHLAASRMYSTWQSCHEKPRKGEARLLGYYPKETLHCCSNFSGVQPFLTPLNVHMTPPTAALTSVVFSHAWLHSTYT